MADLEYDGYDEQTTVPTLLDNAHWGNTPAIEWPVPEESQHAFT